MIRLRSTYRHDWRQGFVLPSGESEHEGIPPYARQRIHELAAAGLVEVINGEIGDIPSPPEKCRKCTPDRPCSLDCWVKLGHDPEAYATFVHEFDAAREHRRALSDAFTQAQTTAVIEEPEPEPEPEPDEIPPVMVAHQPMPPEEPEVIEEPEPEPEAATPADGFTVEETKPEIPARKGKKRGT